jgi:hypothetical protein
MHSPAGTFPQNPRLAATLPCHGDRLSQNMCFFVLKMATHGALHNESIGQRIATLGMVLLAALALCLPAIWNGFPLVYSDTGAYLATAFEGKVPMARPTGYGLFIRYSSLGGHLWCTMLAQGLLFASLLMRTVRVTLPGIASWKSYPLAVVAAVGLTGMAWYASQLMPDIFTGLVALVFFLILFDEGARWWGRLIYAALAYVFCFAHYSHMALLLVLVGLALLLWLSRWVLRKASTFPVGRLLWAAVPVGLTIFSYYYVNYVNDLGWRMTRSAHVFTMGRLSETGMLQEYLHETCAEKHWSLCPYADSLPPTAADFIWNDDSPFKKTGYWEGSRPQYDSLLADFFGRQHYLKIYLKEALISGLTQLRTLSVGEGLTPYNESSSPYKFFERAIPEQVPAFVATRQFERELAFGWEGKLLFATMGLSFFVMLVVWALRRRHMSLGMSAFLMVAVMSYVLNAFLTGALANVYARLQSRIAWLIPLACCLAVMELLQTRRKPQG